MATGGFTLAGVALGEWMSRSANRESAERQLNEQRRIELHGDLAELVTDARAKIDAAWFLIPAYWKMSTEDMMDFVNTDTGRLEGERHVRISGNLVRLGLSLADGPLRSALADFEQCMIDWPDKAMGPVTDRKRKNDFEAVMEGLAHARASREALNAVQREAALALAVPVNFTANQAPKPKGGLGRLISWRPRSKTREDPRGA